MAENIFTRAGRIISTAIEEGLDRLEEASGTALLRQAVRETDYAIDRLERSYNAALQRADKATIAGKEASKKATQWSEKAVFSLSKEREDLAKAALEMQLDSERFSEALSGAAEVARAEAGLLKATLQDTVEQKGQMQKELAEFMKNQHQAELTEAFDNSVRKKVQATLDRFETVMNGISTSEKTRNETRTRTADIDTLQKEADIEERLAKLKNAVKTKKRKK